MNDAVLNLLDMKTTSYLEFALRIPMEIMPWLTIVALCIILLMCLMAMREKKK